MWYDMSDALLQMNLHALSGDAVQDEENASETYDHEVELEEFYECQEEWGEEEDEADEGLPHEEDDNTVEFYQRNLNSPLYPGATIRLVEVLFFLLQFKRSKNVGKSGFDALIKFMKQFLLPPNNILPGSLHMFVRVLEVETWDSFERHVCDREGCVGYAFDYVPRKDWYKIEQEKCRYCEGPRFVTVRRGGRMVMQPYKYFVYLGVESAIRDLFQDTAWAAQRGQSRDMRCGSFWSSPECSRVVEYLREHGISEDEDDDN